MNNITNALNILKCPNCGSELLVKDKGLSCQSGHFFDFAKEGYVNLLLPNQKKTKNPGDDSVMINARDSFLKAGYFEKLKNQIGSTVDFSGKIVLDAGCGTGYYLSSIEAKDCVKIGADISKFAIKKASKNDEKSSYFVASIFNMPIKEQSVDIIFNIFAPKPQQEFKRILKDNGIIVEVVPGKNHLKEIKEIIYNQEAKPNTEKYAFSEFNLLKSNRLTYEIQLKNIKDLNSLLMMTPYWYNGAKNEQNLVMLNLKNITLDFIVNLWVKKENKKID